MDVAERRSAQNGADQAVDGIGRIVELNRTADSSAQAGGWPEVPAHQEPLVCGEFLGLCLDRVEATDARDGIAGDLGRGLFDVENLSVQVRPASGAHDAVAGHHAASETGTTRRSRDPARSPRTPAPPNGQSCTAYRPVRRPAISARLARRPANANSATRSCFQHRKQCPKMPRIKSRLHHQAPAARKTHLNRHAAHNGYGRPHLWHNFHRHEIRNALSSSFRFHLQNRPSLNPRRTKQRDALAALTLLLYQQPPLRSRRRFLLARAMSVMPRT